jgi:hypothetical protein
MGLDAQFSGAAKFRSAPMRVTLSIYWPDMGLRADEAPGRVIPTDELNLQDPRLARVRALPRVFASELAWCASARFSFSPRWRPGECTEIPGGRRRCRLPRAGELRAGSADSSSGRTGGSRPW